MLLPSSFVGCSSQASGLTNCRFCDLSQKVIGIASLCRYVSEHDFDEGGLLQDLQMELLLWASYRGQLLSRAVKGEGVASFCFLSTLSEQVFSPWPGCTSLCSHIRVT